MKEVMIKSTFNVFATVTNWIQIIPIELQKLKVLLGVGPMMLLRRGLFD